jgi:hypothetical protein
MGVDVNPFKVPFQGITLSGWTCGDRLEVTLALYTEGDFKGQYLALNDLDVVAQEAGFHDEGALLDYLHWHILKKERPQASF